jgi:plasmid segregation protein ParM
MSGNSPTQPSFQVRAIDIGYGRTKFTTTQAGACDSFPSLAPLAETRRDDPHILTSRELTGRRTVDVWVDGTPYEVGADTTLFAGEVPVLHADYIDTPQYRALLYGALHAMQLERIDLLVTGLPVHQHASHSARLKKLMTGTHVIRPGKTVEIVDGRVAIQPLGGLIAHLHETGNWARDKKRVYLLIDPGYFTFDWLLSKGLSEVPGMSGSLPCGVSAYLMCIQRELSRELGLYCSDLERIDAGLRDGQFRIWAREVDLQPYKARAEAVIERAIRTLCNRVDVAQNIDEIVLAGGGSFYFLPALQRAFTDRQIHVMKEPACANVRGFHLLGKLLAAKQGKSRKAEITP